MKKTLSIVFALIMALNLTACSTSDDMESNSSDISSESSEPVSDSSDSSDHSDSSDNSGSSDNSDPTSDSDPLPEMDGSTSATPLEIGLKSHFLGIPYNEAKELVSHTTTHDSFKRLIKGEVDLIFSVPISAEQRKMADDAGVKLFMEPVAREGFVFVVNANNPVNSLTQEQLRKIYSGEITNWSQVGGNDEEIIPYQRNTDSGSQNYMTVFMGDTPLLKPKLDFVAGGMAGIMDAVAVYDNSSSAIGYSVYSYAAQMYADADKVKFIAVDGIAPSKSTMADESYPLLSCTYMIYTDKSPESAKKFVEKALSDEGQQCVLESGYLPVNGMEVPEKYLPYQAVGTGEPMPADFKPSDKYSGFQINTRNMVRYTNNPIAVKDKYYEFKSGFLKNADLQERINGDIRAAMDKLRLDGCEFPQDEAEFCSNNPHFYEYCIDDISIEVFSRNGYLSIVLGYFYGGLMIDDLSFLKAETLNYDLFSGKKIERYSDLFYKDEEFLPDVNIQFAKTASGLTDRHKKLDYSGIPGEPRLFTINGVLLDEDNLFFEYEPLLEYDDRFNFHSPVTEYRDMREIFTEEYNLCYDTDYNNEWEIEYVEEDGDVYTRYTGSPFHTAAEVKAEDELWYDLQKRFVKKVKKEDPEWHSTSGISLEESNNSYDLRCFVSMIVGTAHAQFDKKTLELIEFSIR